MKWLNENVAIGEDENHSQIVQINKIIFKGKQHIDWNAVEKYALQYVDKSYVTQTSHTI